jgi:hypothetical protein
MFACTCVCVSVCGLGRVSPYLTHLTPPPALPPPPPPPSSPPFGLLPAPGPVCIVCISPPPLIPRWISASTAPSSCPPPPPPAPPKPPNTLNIAFSSMLCVCVCVCVSVGVGVSEWRAMERMRAVDLTINPGNNTRGPKHVAHHSPASVSS